MCVKVVSASAPNFKTVESEVKERLPAKVSPVKTSYTTPPLPSPSVAITLVPPAGIAIFAPLPQENVNTADVELNIIQTLEDVFGKIVMVHACPPPVSLSAMLLSASDAPSAIVILSVEALATARVPQPSA